MHKKQEKMTLNFQKLILRTTLLISVVLMPLLAYSASDSEGHSSVLSWLGLKDKNMSDVATKIATLHEDNDIRGLDFSPDGKHLAATAFVFQKIHIWDWRNEHIVQTLTKPEAIANFTITELLRYSPDGRYLAACHGPDKPEYPFSDTTLWSTETWEVVHKVQAVAPGICEAIGFTLDGQTFVQAINRGWKFSDADTLMVYRTDTWQRVWGLKTIPFYPSTLAVSPDGKFIAVGGQVMDGKGGPIQPQILIVDTAQRQIIRTINVPQVNRLAWNPDGVHLALGQSFVGSNVGFDAVRIFDVRTGEQVAGEPATEARIDALRYTPDGKYLIESFIDKTIRIWDGQHQHLLQKIPGEVGSLAVSRDGRYVAMGGDGKILIWELK